MPEGLEATAFFARVCQPGLVSWSDVARGAVDLADCFEAARILDWREHCQAIAEVEHG